MALSTSSERARCETSTTVPREWGVCWSWALRSDATLLRCAARAAHRRRRRRANPPTLRTRTQPLNNGKQNSSDSEARLRHALDGVLSLLQGRRAGRTTSWAAAGKQLERAADADPSALADERQLRALAAALGGGGKGSAAAAPALLALRVLLEGAAVPRALQVARAQGVAAGLEACLRSDDIDVATSAACTMRDATQHADAARALLAGAPGLVALAAARLAACAPRAAALEAGVDAGAARGFAGRPGMCWPLLALLTRLSLSDALFSDEAARPPAQLVPAIVAAFALRDADIAESAAALAAHAADSSPAAALQLFTRGDRGALRGVEAALALAERDMKALAAGKRPWKKCCGAVWWTAALVTAACEAGLTMRPQLLASPGAAAWAAAAPWLAARLAALLRAIEPAAAAVIAVGNPDADDDSGRCMVRKAGRLRQAGSALQLLWAWVPKVQRAVEAAQRSGPAGPSCGSGGASCGVGVAALPRCCAACGRTPADGARLHRCRGCGPLTGVMYCGNACAREHWVRRGHRKVCEPAGALLAQLEEEVEKVFGGADSD